MSIEQQFIHKQPSAYFPALTGVRALVAYLVYAHHVRLAPGNLPEVLETFIVGCRAGVTIFFVLSGFLIAYRYAETLQFKQVWFGSYMLRRFARIYPLYFVLSVFMLLWQKNYSGWEWLLNLSLLKAFFDKEKFTGIFQGWSLTVEESFYLAAPLLFLGFRKIGVSTVILLIGIGSIFVFMATQAGSASFLNSYDLMIGMSLFGCSFEFYCGYRLAQYLKTKEKTLRKGSLFTWVGSFCTIAGLLAIGYTTDLKFVFPFPVSPSLIINNFIFPLGIVLWFYGLTVEKTILSSLLGSKPFQVLGKSSYAFYLIHMSWFFEVIYFHIHQSRITTFFLLIVWSVGIYYCFEEPVNQYIRKKFDAWDLRRKIKREPAFLRQKA